MKSGAKVECPLSVGQDDLRLNAPPNEMAVNPGSAEIFSDI